MNNNTSTDRYLSVHLSVVNFVAYFVGGVVGVSVVVGGSLMDCIVSNVVVFIVQLSFNKYTR